MGSPTDRFRRVDAVFDACLDLPESEQPAFIDRACGTDAELRNEVLQLLRAHRRSEGLLDAPAARLAGSLLGGLQESPHSLPERIGVFRIVRQIGQGGMGRVFLGERADGQFDQRVALKVITHRDGDLVRRFLKERRILARLEHTGIARLLDGGVMDDGAPWFAMEFVEGEPIDSYCETRALSLERRLALMIDVCDGVTYAHQHLVVHSDLKPANILVTRDGQVKLLDFGIAQLLDGRKDNALATGTHFKAMTPEFAAPEQIRGESVSTATDVYSLGVLLYLLLTGERPYDLHGKSPVEVERIVCDLQPPLPSSVARGQMRRRLTRDLDLIVQTALKKQPDRRYASPAALAQDLRRFLDGHPVAARPDSAVYRLRKFSGRHRVAVAAAAVAAVTLAAAASRERVLRNRAESEARKAREVGEYLVQVFDVADPYAPERRNGGDVTARQLLARGVERADALSGQPGLQATLLGVTGRIYYNLGDAARAEDVYRRALETWNKSRPEPEHELERGRALYGLARAIEKQDRFAEAEPLLRQLVQLTATTSKTGELRAAALLDLYSTLHALDRQEAADSAFLEWEATLVRTPPALDGDAAMTMMELGRVLGYRGQVRGDSESLRRGLALIDRALVTLRAVHGPRHPRVADILNLKASLLIAQISLTPRSRQPDARLLASADSLTREAVALYREIYREPSHELWESLSNRASLLLKRKAYDEAAAVAHEAIAVGEAVPGRDRTSWIDGKSLLAEIDMARGEYGRAARTYQEIRDSWVRSNGENYLLTLSFELSLGDALTRDGQFAAAEPHLLNAYERLNAQRGATDRYTQSAVRHLVTLYERWNKPERAAHFRALTGAASR